MGTNYYLHKGKQPCTCCNLSSDRDPTHIGKSSYGWTFALHVLPELGITSLESWLKFIEKDGPNTIFNEYGEIVSIDEFKDIVLKRGNGNYCMSNDDADKRRTHEYGKPVIYHPVQSTLRRHNVDGEFCVGHGPDDATYDLIRGHFS